MTFDQGDRNLRQFWTELGYAQVVSIEGGVAESQDRVVEVGDPAEGREVGQNLIELLVVDLHRDSPSLAVVGDSGRRGRRDGLDAT